MQPQTLPTDWQRLQRHWLVTLAAERFSPKSVRTYKAGVDSLLRWLAAHDPEVTPETLTRHHVREWLAERLAASGGSTGRTYFAAVRSFAKWLHDEGEAAVDATAGIKTPPSPEPITPVLDDDAIRRLLAACRGDSFQAKRDNAIMRVAIDTGIRLGELADLRVADVNEETGQLTVHGKGTARRGPRERVVQVGVRTQRALLAYLRARDKHAHRDDPALWLSAHGGHGPGLRHDSFRRLVKRYGVEAGIPELHCHMFRHTWASEFQRDEGSEGDLATLGGWRNYAVMRRYGAAAAGQRAAEGYRRRGTLGDRY